MAPRQLWFTRPSHKLKFCGTARVQNKIMESIHPNKVLGHICALKNPKPELIRRAIKQISLLDLVKLYQILPSRQVYIKHILNRNPLPHQIEQLFTQFEREMLEVAPLSLYCQHLHVTTRNWGWFVRVPFPDAHIVEYYARDVVEFERHFARLSPRMKQTHCLPQHVDKYFLPDSPTEWRRRALILSSDPAPLLARCQDPTEQEVAWVRAHEVEKHWRELPDLVVDKIQLFLEHFVTELEFVQPRGKAARRMRCRHNKTCADKRHFYSSR